MGNNDFRAKQFLPFDALKGFYDAIGCENIVKLEKKSLSEDILKELDNKLNKLNIGDSALIKYYSNFDYIETSGVIKKIDKVYKKIYIFNSIIDIENVVDIKIL